MARRRRGERLPPAPEEQTSEITGSDARPEEADFGSAEQGASLNGADLTGGFRELEDEATGADILPDHEEKLSDAPEFDEDTLTARPTSPPTRDELERAVEEQREDRPGMTSEEAELA